MEMFHFGKLRGDVLQFAFSRRIGNLEVFVGAATAAAAAPANYAWAATPLLA